MDLSYSQGAELVNAALDAGISYLILHLGMVLDGLKELSAISFVIKTL